MSGLDFLTRLVPALLVVLSIPLAAMWWQRTRGSTQRQMIRITAKTPIGRNMWIAVLEVDGRRFLVSSAERGTNLISELEPAPEDPELAADSADISANTTTGSAWNADSHGPRTGLIRRLQERTLRRPAPDRGPDAGP